MSSDIQELLKMSSEALRILDENTTQYMLEMYRDEVKKLKKEAEKQKEAAKQKEEAAKAKEQLMAKDGEIEDMQESLKKAMDEIAALKARLDGQASQP